MPAADVRNWDNRHHLHPWDAMWSFGAADRTVTAGGEGIYLYDDQGRLLCRYPAAAVPRLEGLVTGAQVLPTLGSGAIPPEVTTVSPRHARELTSADGELRFHSGPPG